MSIRHIFERFYRMFWQDLAQALCPYWDEIESTYIDSSKTVFRKVRQERERVIRHLYQMRKDFVAFLKRPDTKQDFLSQWQKVGNTCS